MEMWWLGFYMDRVRLCLFLVLAFPLLVGLSYHAGFEETFRLREDVVDAFVAYAVGFIASGVALLLFDTGSGAADDNVPDYGNPSRVRRLSGRSKAAERW